MADGASVDDTRSIEARLDAVEILLREVLGFTLGRGAIVDRARRTADALESEAVLSGDQGRREPAAEVRAAVERLTESSGGGHAAIGMSSSSASTGGAASPAICRRKTSAASRGEG